MKTNLKTLRSLPLAAAMLLLTAGSALAQSSFSGANKTDGDNWNVSTNWTPSGIPTGAVSVIIPNNKQVTAQSSTTPTYNGSSLSIGSNSLLQIGFNVSNAESYRALGTPGTTTISMGSGSQLAISRIGGTYTIPAIQLLGNAIIRTGESTNGAPILNFNHGISGAYTVTFQGKSDSKINLNAANSFSALVADWTNYTYSEMTITAAAAGSLGNGDVTVKPYADGTSCALLVINAANAMADTATLTLNGSSANKLTMNANDTIGKLVVNGAVQPAGTYGKVGQAGVNYQVSWIKSTSTGILTVAGPSSNYWDLNGTDPGACTVVDIPNAPATWDAANLFWNATADGTTTSPTFWSAGQAAVFAAGTDATGTYAVTVSGTQAIGGLTVEEGNVTLSGDGLQMTADSFVQVASGSSATIGNIISNDATPRQLAKGGSGTLTLSGANTYAGSTTVGGGTLSIPTIAGNGSNSPLGNFPSAGAGGLTLAGGTLQYTGSTATTNRGFTLLANSTVDVSGIGTALTLGASSGGGTLTVTGGSGSSLSLGAVTLVTSLTLNPTTGSLTVASVTGLASSAGVSGAPGLVLGGSASGNSLTGIYSGVGTLTKSGYGDWKLNGASTYTGNTTVQTGNLIAGTNAANNAAGAFGQQNNVEIPLGVAGGNSDAGILISGGAFTIGRVIRLATNNATDAGTRVITLGGNSAHNTIYSAAVHLGTASQTSRGVRLTAATSGQVTFSGGILEPTGQDAAEAAAAAALTAVTKVGLGTVVLSAANTYTGGTLVSEGTLSLGNGTTNSNLHDLSTLSVATGAFLNLNFTGFDTVYFLNIGGSPMPAGQYGHTNSGATNGGAGVGFYDAYFAANGGIINNTNGLLSTGLYAWDGTSSNIGTNGNGASAGGNGNWDASIQNWDVGNTAHAVWGNTATDSAIFGGTAGTVTLDANLNIQNLTVSLPDGTGSGYSIGNVGEDHTLTFAGTKTVTATANGTGSNQDVIIRAGIAGSPTMNIAGRLANSVDQFSLLPGSGVTQTIGTLNMLNTFASNKRLILGGTSTGNVVDTVTWSITNNQIAIIKAGTGAWTINNNLAFNSGGSRASRFFVEQGTLTLGGTNNFFTHKVGVSTTRETVFTASGTASKLIAKGTFTIGDNREFFYVQNLGTLSPGPGVQTLNVTWNANSSSSTANGEFNMQTGSTYEWDVASSTSTDKINVTTGASNNGNLKLGNMTIKVNDAGVTTPIAAGDQLPVFTYETGAQIVLRSIGTITIDISALGAGWSGTPSLVDNNAGTIYITGLTFSTGPPSVTLTGAPIAAVDTTYGAASPTPTSFTVSGSNLTGAPGNLTVTPPSGYEVSLSIGSGYTTSLSVPYASASLSATTVYLRLAATATVTGSPYSGDVSVSGGGLVSPATIATVSSSVSKASPTVTVTVGSYTYSGAAQGPTGFTTSPTGDTGTPTWEYVGTGATTYGPSATLPTGGGTYTAAVSLAADDNFNAASSSATAFTINKADQTINFTLSSPVDRSAGTVALSATATSGLTVSFASSAPTIASVSGSTLTLLQGGSINVTASQAGDSNYNPAPAVPQPLIITGYTAVADAATRPTNSPSIKIPVATLLANDGAVGPGGAVTPGVGLTLTAVTAGTGNTVTFDATWVYYTPTIPANSDPLTFTYTSSNGANTATATVTVTTVDDAPFDLDIIRVVTAAAYDAMLNSTSVTIEFAGVPNQTYDIQYSTNLMGWSTPAAYPTGVTGTFNATFTAPGNVASAWSALFFRATR